MATVAMVFDLLVGKDTASPGFTRFSNAANTAAVSATKAETTIAGFSKKATAALGALAAVDVGAHMVKSAAQFQQSMLLIQTQAGASAGEVKKMSAAVLGLAGPVGTAPEKLATSLYHIESVGLRGAKALGVLKIAAEGAKVGNANLEETTNALTSTVASGIGGVKNMGQAMGQLNAIVGAGDMHLSDLNDALSTGLLANMRAFGLSLPQVGAALAVFGDNNIRGANAASDLRQAVMAMAKPVVGGTAALKSIGIASGELKNDLSKGGLTSALDDLRSKMTAAGDTGSKVGAFITDAFGKKAGVGLAVLLEEMDRYHTKLVDIKTAGQQFSSAWSATTKTAVFQFDRIKASVDAVGITIGTALLPAVTTLAGALGGVLLGAVGAVQSAAKPFAAIWDGLASVLGPVGHAFSTIGSALSPLAPALKATSGAALALWAGMKAGQLVGAVFTSLASGFETLQIKALYAQDSIAAGWARVSTAATMAAEGTGFAAAAIGAEAEGASATVIASGEAAEAGWAGLAGPLGIAAVGVVALVSMFHKSSSASKEATAAAKAYTQALQSDGKSTIIDTITKQLSDNKVPDTLAKLNAQFKNSGVDGQQFITAIQQQGKPLDTLRSKLEAVIKAGTVKGPARGPLNGLYDTNGVAAATKLLGDLNAQQKGLSKAQAEEIKQFKAFGTVVTPIQTVADATGLATTTIQAYAGMVGIAATKNNNFGGSSKTVIAAVDAVAAAYNTASQNGSEYLAALNTFSSSAGTASDRSALIGATLKANAGDALGYASSMNGAAAANSQFSSDVASAAKAAKESTLTYLGSIVNLKKGTIDYNSAAAAPFISDLQGIQTAAINAAAATYQHNLKLEGGKRAADDAVAGYQGVETSLEGQLQKLDLTSGAAQKLTERYLGVPKNVKTLIEQEGANPVVTVLNKIGRLLATITGQSWDAKINVTANIAASASRAQNLLNNVRGSDSFRITNKSSAPGMAVGTQAAFGRSTIPPNTRFTVGEAGWEGGVTDSQGRASIFSNRQSKAMGFKAPKRYASGTLGGGTGDESLIASFLKSMGLSRNGVAAFLGNFSVETGGSFSPTSYNPKENAHGYANWEGGRWTALQNLAAKMGVSATSSKAELAYLAKELHGRYSGVLSAIKGKSASQAAAIVDAQFEGSSGDARGQRMSRASAIARQLGSGKLATTGGDFSVNGISYASARAAQNALVRAQTALSKELPKFATAIAGTTDQLKSAEATLLNDVKAVGASSKVLSQVQKDFGKLNKLAAARDSLQAQLGTPDKALAPTAYQNLADAMSKFNDEASTVASAFTSGFSLQSAGTLDPTTAAAAQAAALARFTDPTAGGIQPGDQALLDGGGSFSLPQALTALSQSVGAAQTFSNQLKQLDKSGFTKTAAGKSIYQQVAELGPSQGEDELSALLGGSSTQLKALLSGTSKLASLGASAGQAVATVEDGDQVKAAQATVELLKQQIASDKAEMAKQTKAIVAAIHAIGGDVGHALDSVAGKAYTAARTTRR